MDDYRPNSKLKKNPEGKIEKTKPDNKKIEKIVSGKVVKKKKSWITKLFVSENETDLKSYIVDDILIPAGKRAISDIADAMGDIVRNTISMALYGEEARPSRRGGASRISYRDYYDRRESSSRRESSRRVSGYAYDEVILETRAEAEDVLNRLDELISIYGMASVADLYDLVGISGQYTDNKYGWTDTRSATSVRVRDGYLLKMPRAIPLN